MPEPVREESPWKSLAEFFSPSSARNCVPMGRRTEGLMAFCNTACLIDILLYSYCLPLSLITMPEAELPCRSSPLELPEVVMTAAACIHPPSLLEAREGAAEVECVWAGEGKGGIGGKWTYAHPSEGHSCKADRCDPPPPRDTILGLRPPVWPLLFSPRACAIFRARRERRVQRLGEGGSGKITTKSGSVPLM